MTSLTGTLRRASLGTRRRRHLPPQYDRETPLPVIMAIHGCGMTGFGWNSMKSTAQFNALADGKGFFVVYPTQQLFRSAINCWNSADPREQHRHTGEPALLAGVAREVVETYGPDPDEVHVAGASSGADTAVILGVTYPDLVATVTSVAGGEYGLNQVDPDAPDSTPPDYTARQAWAQLGERARQVPLLIIQGETTWCRRSSPPALSSTGPPWAIWSTTAFSTTVLSWPRGRRPCLGTKDVMRSCTPRSPWRTGRRWSSRAWSSPPARIGVTSSNA